MASLVVAVAAFIGSVTSGPGGGPDFSTLVPPAPLPAMVQVDGIGWLPEVDTVVMRGAVVPAALDLPIWDALLGCEWGDRGWDDPPTGNGFEGPGQWVLATYQSTAVGRVYRRPSLTPPALQLEAMRENLDRGGWLQWPGCARRLGYLN